MMNNLLKPFLFIIGVIGTVWAIYREGKKSGTSEQEVVTTNVKLAEQTKLAIEANNAVKREEKRNEIAAENDGDSVDAINDRLERMWTEPSDS